jgi:hypothetical protein
MNFADERKIQIYPDKLRQFHSDGGNREFVVIAGSDIGQYVEICATKFYKKTGLIIYSGQNSSDFVDVINETSNHADIFILCPQSKELSINPDSLGNRKIAMMIVNATPTSVSQIKHFVSAVEDSDPTLQKERLEKIVSQISNTDFITLRDDEAKSEATLLTYDDSSKWYVQGGVIESGSQSTLPSGEISMFPKSDPQKGIVKRLPLKGPVIVHSGSSHYDFADQERIYQSFRKLESSKLKIEIKDGMISRIIPLSQSANEVKITLESLFLRDDRYRIIEEFGFGINTSFELWQGNTSMNETYGGSSGIVHFGIGLPPFTEYHIDFFSLDLRLFSNHGDAISI